MTDLVMKTDLLILDDLGTEYLTPFYSSTIYNIINTRLNFKKPTIISTNLTHEEIQERYDERVVSRITTQYKNMQFTKNIFMILNFANKNHRKGETKVEIKI